MTSSRLWVTLPEQQEASAAELFTALDADAGFFAKKCQQFIENGRGTATLNTLRDRRVGRECDTLLHSAAKLGSASIVAFLLENGCDANALSSSLTLLTPLHCALALQHVHVACVLVASGARCDILDINGDNIFHYIARTGSVCTLKKIVAEARLSESNVQLLASSANCKRRKLPEDVAVGDLMVKVLQSYRETGIYNSPPRQRKAKKAVSRLLR